MLSCSYRVFWGFSRMIYHSISAPFLEYKHRALAARYASGIFHYQVSSYTYPPRWLYSNWSSTYIPGKSTSGTRKWFGLHHTPLEGHQHLKMLGHLIHVNLRGPPRTACHPPSRHKAPGMATGQTLSFSWLIIPKKRCHPRIFRVSFVMGDLFPHIKNQMPLPQGLFVEAPPQKKGWFSKFGIFDSRMSSKLHWWGNITSHPSPVVFRGSLPLSKKQAPMDSETAIMILRLIEVSNTLIATGELE